MAGQGSNETEATAAEPLDQPWRPKPVKSFDGLTIAECRHRQWYRGCFTGQVALWRTHLGARYLQAGFEPSRPRNVEKHGVSSQVTLLESDLLSAVEKQTFDLIVSNPPYISDSEYEQLPASVKNYEPKAALVSGPTGTEIVKRLFDQSVHRLRSGGWLIVEISPMIAEAVTKLVDRHCGANQPSLRIWLVTRALSRFPNCKSLECSSSK